MVSATAFACRYKNKIRHTLIVERRNLAVWQFVSVSLGFICSLTTNEGSDMKVKLMAAVSAAVIGLTAAVAVPNKAEANWRGGWWVPGAVIGGIALGAAIASRPYYYGPGYYGYASGPYYYGGGPYYYGGGPYYGRRCWWRNGYRVCRGY
jgi:hypothetical protein